MIEVVGGESEVGRSAVMSLRSKRRNRELLGAGSDAVAVVVAGEAA